MQSNIALLWVVATVCRSSRIAVVLTRSLGTWRTRHINRDQQQFHSAWRHKKCVYCGTPKYTIFVRHPQPSYFLKCISTCHLTGFEYEHIFPFAFLLKQSRLFSQVRSAKFFNLPRGAFPGVKFHYRFYKRPPTVPMLSQLDPFHTPHIPRPEDKP